MSTYFKWEVGDRVKVADEYSFFYGRSGVVSHYNEELFHNVFVRFDDNEKCNFRIKELEKADEYL